jgi:glycerol uptake operon antiterminator
MAGGESDPRRVTTASTAKSGDAALTPLRVYSAESPIIPAIRRPELVERAVASNSKLIYLLAGDPENIEGMIRGILAADKIPLVNLDLLNGFSRDRYAVNYLKKVGARGIISTHLDPLRHALSIGLYAIQRTFLLDSGAMDAISNQLKNSPVHALEVLPALVAPKILSRVQSLGLDLPVVGGGLIETMKEVEALLTQGLSAVSTSNVEMWIR